MSENSPKPPLNEEELHRRLWLQYALQTPPPRPLKRIGPKNLQKNQSVEKAGS